MNESLKLNIGENHDKEQDSGIPKQTAKEEREEELSREYLDNRNIIISLVHNYPFYRKVNMKTMGRRRDIIGSCITSSRVLSSNQEEVEAYFPAIVGVSAAHPDFIIRVKQWLNNIQFAISENDVKLDISFRYRHKSDYLKIKQKEDEINKAFEEANKSNTSNLKDALAIKINDLNALESTKYEYGYPVNVEQYLIYRHCLLYKDVAKDISLINSDPNIRFYIKDESKEKEKQQKYLKEKNIAKRNYVEMIGDDKKFDSIFTQYCVQQGYNLSDYLAKDRLEKEIILDTFSTETPDKFNKMFNDKNIDIKAFIELLIVKGELIRSQYNQNITSANGDFIGANINEAVAYFNNPENKDIVAGYKNKLKYL